MPTIRKVYLYEETHLPQKGWLQGCMICGVITSHLLLFKTKFDEKKEMKYEIYTYICPSCKKNLKNIPVIIQMHYLILNYQKVQMICLNPHHLW